MSVGWAATATVRACLLLAPRRAQPLDLGDGRGDLQRDQALPARAAGFGHLASAPRESFCTVSKNVCTAASLRREHSGKLAAAGPTSGAPEPSRAPGSPARSSGRDGGRQVWRPVAQSSPRGVWIASTRSGRVSDATVLGAGRRPLRDRWLSRRARSLSSWMRPQLARVGEARLDLCLPLMAAACRGAKPRCIAGQDRVARESCSASGAYTDRRASKDYPV